MSSMQTVSYWSRRINSTPTGRTLRELPWAYSERSAVGGSRKITLQLVMTARTLRAKQPSVAKR
jgi:hypothetical protein